VIKALSDMDASRRCYRMVGGVLVERTVGEVLPVVTANHSSVCLAHSRGLIYLSLLT
jgi:prefoldin subunit 2